MKVFKGCGNERYFIITTDGFAFPLPHSLTPQTWLSPLQLTVYGFPFSTKQVRTDDYGRTAGGLYLSGRLTGPETRMTETGMHLEAERIRAFVQKAAWLQRSDRASLELLPGSDIDLKPDGKNSAVAVLDVVVVARNRKWIGADGREVTG